ncbi:hypothetical protein KP509_15G019200 [Ceratopteris richardii]|nr:hypothetical protein KP509_15G019200 [Ceratopteris richardii]
MRILRYDVEAERIQGQSRTRDISTDELLEQLPALQQLLYRLVGCQPEGAAGRNYVIQYALALVLKESFKLYCAINDGIINLIDKFFEMQRHEAMKALEIYRRASQQADKLSEFYDSCKNLELARNFQFPSLAQPPQSFLATMEDYVKDAPRLMTVPKEIGDYNDEIPMTRLRITYYEKGEPEPEQEPEASPLPAHHDTSPDLVTPRTISSNDNYRSHEPDFLGLHEGHPDASALEESNALALAIVPSEYTSNGTAAHNPISHESTGWELAIVTNPSSNDSALQNSKMGGGFDQLTLDSLYESEQMRRSLYTTQNTYGSVSNPFSAGLNSQDPFSASNTIPPPPSVQLAAMAQQQQMMMIQQQQNFQQQQFFGAPAVSNPFVVPYAQNPPQQYQNNPFGNPGLL